jgi:Flp pilus assembly protein TadG
MKNRLSSAFHSLRRSTPPSAGLQCVNRRLLRLAQDQPGNTIVETAVTLPVFLLVCLGVAQYAIVLLTYCNGTFACREASRYASMHSATSLAPDTPSQIKGIVTSQLFINPTITPTVSVNYYTQNLSPVSAAVGNNIGYVVQVSVTWSQTVTIFPGSSITAGLLNQSTWNTFSISTANNKVITR